MITYVGCNGGPGCMSRDTVVTRPQWFTAVYTCLHQHHKYANSIQYKCNKHNTVLGTAL